MDRREFLTGAGAVSIGGIAGCSGSSSPEMEFQSFIVPDPVGMSIDRTDRVFTSEIHNRGELGIVRLELWFFRDQNVPDPEVPSQFANGEGRQFETARSQYIGTDRREEIELTAQNSLPEQWEYGIMAWPASHGAAFKNTGGTGVVEVKFKFRDTKGYDLQEPPTKREEAISGETIHFGFRVVVPPRVEYEIIVET
ncbi:hypothetical protein ACLI4Q_16310 [Natrialbaceae archaeon A-CW1-1]